MNCGERESSHLVYLHFSNTTKKIVPFIMHTYSTRRENTLEHVDRRKNQRHPPPPPYFPLLQDFIFLLENKRKPKKE